MDEPEDIMLSKIIHILTNILFSQLYVESEKFKLTEAEWWLTRA